MILALNPLQPHFDDIEYDYKHNTGNPELLSKEFYERKMYQVGMLRLVLDITHLGYRTRIIHEDNMIPILNKWNNTYKNTPPSIKL